MEKFSQMQVLEDLGGMLPRSPPPASYGGTELPSHTSFVGLFSPQHLSSMNSALHSHQIP